MMLAALRAVLKVLRGELDVSVGGFRASLKNGECPTASAFQHCDPAFGRKCRLLGAVARPGPRRSDRGAGPAHAGARELQDFNDKHLQAFFAHLLVTKLHITLLGHISPVNQTSTEAETRTFVANMPKPMDAAELGTLRVYQWHNRRRPRSLRAGLGAARVLVLAQLGPDRFGRAVVVVLCRVGDRHT